MQPHSPLHRNLLKTSKPIPAPHQSTSDAGIFIHIASQERIKEIDLMGIKIMLLGIAVILAGIALSISNIFAFAGGVAGLLLSIAGIFVRDNNRAEK